MKNSKLTVLLLSLVTSFSLMNFVPSNISYADTTAASSLTAASETDNADTDVSENDSLVSSLPAELSQADWAGAKKSIQLSTGINMKYLEMGNKDGKPIIFVHGLSDSSRGWSMITKYFANDYHMYIIDNRGHGDSDKPVADAYPISLYADDLNAFMNELNIEKADIVGHSLGTFIAQVFTIEHPEKVNHLLLESGCLVRPSDVWAQLYQMAVDFGDEYPSDEFIDAWYYSPHETNPEFMSYQKATAKTLPPYVWRAITKGGCTSDFADRTTEITVPTMILWGTDDKFFNYDEQNDLREKLPNAEFVTFQDTGHSIHWENPEGFARTALQFLGK